MKCTRIMRRVFSFLFPVQNNCSCFAILLQECNKRGMTWKYSEIHTNLNIFTNSDTSMSTAPS